VLRSVINGICWVMSRQCNVWDRYRQVACVCAANVTMVFSFSFFVSRLAPFYRTCHSNTFLHIQKVPGSNLVRGMKLRAFKFVFNRPLKQ